MATLENSTSKPYSVSASTKKLNLDQRQRRWGWVFLAPWIIGFFAFTFLPMLASFVFTFLHFDLSEPDNVYFNDFANYERLMNDPDVRTGLTVTLQYAAISLPFAILIPLGLATLLNSKQLIAKRFFRTLFYMPYVVPLISVIYIFNSFLNARGWLNRFLINLGLNPPDWLFDPFWIYPALMLIGVWGTGNAMLTMLASMQTVPTELYEAARVDGANRVTIFRKITLPMISPVIFYNLVLALIGLFRYFDVPYIIKRGTGDPGNATLFYNIVFYRNAFYFQDMGYGATLAWLMFVIAMITTVIVFATAPLWVYYSGDRE